MYRNYSSLCKLKEREDLESCIFWCSHKLSNDFLMLLINSGSWRKHSFQWLPRAFSSTAERRALYTQIIFEGPRYDICICLNDECGFINLYISFKGTDLDHYWLVFACFIHPAIKGLTHFVRSKPKFVVAITSIIRRQFWRKNPKICSLVSTESQIRILFGS